MQLEFWLEEEENVGLEDEGRKIVKVCVCVCVCVENGKDVWWQKREWIKWLMGNHFETDGVNRVEDSWFRLSVKGNEEKEVYGTNVHCVCGSKHTRMNNKRH